MKENSEPLGVLPQPVSRPARPQEHPGTGVIAEQEVVVGRGNKFDANSVYSIPRQRITKSELPTIEQIRSDIEQLRADVEQAQADYATINLDQWYAPLKAAEATVAELRAALAEAEAGLKEAQEAGSPKHSFTKFVIAAEVKVTSLSRTLFTRFLETASLAAFKISADRLSAAVRHDLGIQFEDRFRRFTNFARLHRVENPLEETVKANADRVVEALDYLLTEIEK